MQRRQQSNEKACSWTISIPLFTDLQGQELLNQYANFMISNRIIFHDFGFWKILYEILSKFYPTLSDNLIGESETIWSLKFILIYCIIY